MEDERWQRIQQLYHAAMELDAARRAAFIQKACGADEGLRGEVMSLLVHGAEESFLGAPAMEVAARAMAGSAATEAISRAAGGGAAMPPAIGRYRVVRLLGEGGMGTVYEAEQDQPRRTVALKIIRPGFATAENLRRFQHESQALGRLQHPGIAQIHEASTADTGFGPQPFFAMELIRGRSLVEYADVMGLGTRQRLAVMAKVCDAVEHAHQRGVIHRDLKPGNILVDETGQPKILDFGVARVTESDVQHTRQTDLGQLVGTLAYMSPEQVLGDPLALDIRSDVYALGVLLYELLASKLPYDISRKPVHEAIEMIRNEEPAPLSSINRSYRGDIDTIVTKALEKDKARRYGSAAELAADIRRYLTDEPIAARPASASYQLQKFARRHQGLVAGAAAVFMVLAAGVVVSTWEAVRARQAQASSQAVIDFLRNDVLAQASGPNQYKIFGKTDPDLKVRTALDQAASRISGKFARQPEVEVAIRSTIGAAYSDLGLSTQAQKQAERVVELQRRKFGAENLETLKAMNRLAHTMKNAEAIPLYSRILEISRRKLGPEASYTLGSMHDLAQAYRYAGQYAKAEALQTKALEGQLRVLGPEHRETLDSMENLGVLCYKQGKFDQAEALFRRSLEIQRRTLGPEHPETLQALSGLAVAYDLHGKYAQAEPLYKQVLEISQRIAGLENPFTLGYMMNLADIYAEQGKFPQADELQSQILNTQRRLFGLENPGTLDSMYNLGLISFNEGKYAQAEQILQQNIELRRRVQGAEHPATLDSMYNLAAVYAAQRKFIEAEGLFARTLEIQRRVLPAGNPGTLETLAGLSFMYQRLGKYSSAERYAAEGLAGRRRTLGSDNPDTMQSAADLALAYQSQGKFAESEPLSREAVEFGRKKQPEQWQRFRVESLLGASLAGQKKYAEAEPLLLEGYQGMLARKDQMGAPNSYHLDRAQEWVAQLYRAWGRPKKTAEFTQQFSGSN